MGKNTLFVDTINGLVEEMSTKSLLYLASKFICRSDGEASSKVKALLENL
jgi:hypothetical protein